MSMKGSGEGPRAPVWKGSLSPDEVHKRNRETMEERGERNRQKLLGGIDPELIPITRRKCEIILGMTDPVDRGQAETMIDEIVRSKHPKVLLSLIHGASEEVRKTSPVSYAAYALAFQALTN